MSDFTISELEAKYKSALLNIVADYERGRYTAREAKVAFSAVYQTVSGLVDINELQEIGKEIMELT